MPITSFEGKLKSYILQDSSDKTLWNRQSYEDSKKIGDCQGEGRWRHEQRGAFQGIETLQQNSMMMDSCQDAFIPNHTRSTKRKLWSLGDNMSLQVHYICINLVGSVDNGRGHTWLKLFGKSSFLLHHALILKVFYNIKPTEKRQRYLICIAYIWNDTPATPNTFCLREEHLGDWEKKPEGKTSFHVCIRL